jgi:hypothetical protein
MKNKIIKKKKRKKEKELSHLEAEKPSSSNRELNLENQARGTCFKHKGHEKPSFRPPTQYNNKYAAKYINLSNHNKY